MFGIEREGPSLIGWSFGFIKPRILITLLRGPWVPEFCSQLRLHLQLPRVRKDLRGGNKSEDEESEKGRKYQYCQDHEKFR